MADVNASYNLHYSPNPCSVDITVSIRNAEPYITLNNFPTLAVTASPKYSGNVISGFVSTIGTPIVNAITLFLGAVAGQFLNGKSFGLGVKIQPITQSVEGISVSLNPTSLNVSNFNGYLKISGDLSVQ